MNRTATCTAALALVVALPATSADHSGHGGIMTQHGLSERGGMMRVSNDAGATGQAIINSVDTESKVVNLTHGPMPSLNWPEMTMDLPVADGVDLSRVQPGAAVRFRVVLGEDQVYRITSMRVMP